MSDVPVRIYTYASTDERLPEWRRAMAWIEMQMPGKKVKVIWDFNPVLIHAETEEAARKKAEEWFKKAEEWFEDQLELERRKQANSEKRLAAMRAAREASK